MRTLIVTACFASIALAGSASIARAQSPRSTTICEDPSYRGTAIYNQYCGGRGGGTFTPQPPPPADPNRTFVIDRVSFTGEFYVVTRDGRRLTGQNAAQASIDNGARAITGPTGHAVLTLPDGTTFTIGPGSEVALDSFVYEPGENVRKMTMNVVKGVFRWITGKIAPRYKPTIKLPICDLGIRGTDFEFSVEPGGSGYIKLNSGELELMDYDTANVTIIHAGQTVRFADFKIIP